MARAPKFGVNYYKGVTRRKRPGRHAKRTQQKILKKEISWTRALNYNTLKQERSNNV